MPTPYAHKELSYGSGEYAHACAREWLSYGFVRVICGRLFSKRPPGLTLATNGLFYLRLNEYNAGGKFSAGPIILLI